MATPSPAVYVQDGGGAQVTTPPIDVVAGDTITIGLVSTAGVNTWAIVLYGQDESVSPPTLTINNTTKTATFTAPSAPWTLIYKSTVNGGVDINGVSQSSYSATVGIHCKTGAGTRLGASNETLESNATTGWVGKLNASIRGSNVTWANDLAGSTFTNQYVASISGNAGAGGTIAVNATTFQFAAAQASASFTQASTSSASGATMKIAAQSSSLAAGNGGALLLQGGGKGASGLRGPARLQTTPDGSTFETMVEACEVVSGNRVLALAQRGTGITSTNMPANTGDGVVFLTEAATAPTANPSGGTILYVDPADHKLKCRTANGTTTTLGP